MKDVTISKEEHKRPYNPYIAMFAALGWTLAVFLLLGKFQDEQIKTRLNINLEKSNKIVSALLPDLESKVDRVKANQDTDFTPAKPSAKNEPSIFTQTDTVKSALDKTVKDQVTQETRGLRDSVAYYRSLYANSSTQLAAEKISRRNVIVQLADPKKKIVTDKNASISLYEFSMQRNPGSIFSPMRDYLKITNNADSGLINNRPELNYELNNDQIFQLMFQLRGAISPFNGRSTVGVGAELKLDRVSVSTVLNYANKPNGMTNNFVSRFSPSLGIRYDFKRIVFK